MNTVRENKFDPIFRELRERQHADLYKRIHCLLRAIGEAEDEVIQTTPTVRSLTDAWIMLGDACLILEEILENGLPGNERNLKL